MGLFLQMNERKPTWQCPVCDKPAMYDSLMVDGYFLDVIKDPLLPSEENEIILNQDGSWHPVPKEEEEAKKKKEEKEKEEKDEVDLVDLSDDDGEGGATKKSAAASSGSVMKMVEVVVDNRMALLLLIILMMKVQAQCLQPMEAAHPQHHPEKLSASILNRWITLHYHLLTSVYFIEFYNHKMKKKLEIY